MVSWSDLSFPSSASSLNSGSPSKRMLNSKMTFPVLPWTQVVTAASRIVLCAVLRLVYSLLGHIIDPISYFQCAVWVCYSLCSGVCGSDNSCFHLEKISCLLPLSSVLLACHLKSPDSLLIEHEGQTVARLDLGWAIKTTRRTFDNSNSQNLQQCLWLYAGFTLLDN